MTQKATRVVVPGLGSRKGPQNVNAADIANDKYGRACMKNYSPEMLWVHPDAGGHLPCFYSTAKRRWMVIKIQLQQVRRMKSRMKRRTKQMTKRRMKQTMIAETSAFLK